MWCAVRPSDSPPRAFSFVRSQLPPTTGDNLYMNGHALKQSMRFTRGRSPIGTRPLHGYMVRCECGWTLRVNGSKRDASGHHRDRVAELKASATPATLPR